MSRPGHLLLVLLLLALAGCKAGDSFREDPEAATFTLIVGSESPAFGIQLDVAPADVDGRLGGESPFERTFEEHTEVTLTAPEVSEDNAFLHWALDGEFLSDEREIAFSMRDDHTATAVFSTTTTLTVASEGTAEGVAVQAAPPDTEGTDDGTTPFTLGYLIGQRVELHPEAVTPDGRYFRTWIYDGPEPDGTQAITLEVSREATATAHYAEAAAVVDTTYEIGGRPRGLPENEMVRSLELDVLSEEAIEENRIGIFYESAEGLLALPHETRFDLSGNGEGDTPAHLYFALEPGRLTLRYQAETDGYVHPGWLPERIVVVLYDDDAPLASAESP